MAKRFNPAPGWPDPPAGWLPADDWEPDPSWPAAPEGWEVVVDDGPTRKEWLKAVAGRVVANNAIDDPNILWRAESATLTSAATGGRAVKGRYRLTHEFLYFERGTLRTDAQQVPIVGVMDVDVKQSMTQKARGVGDVIVHIQRPTGIELVTMESIPQPRQAQQIINDTARRARHAAQERANTLRYTQAIPPAMYAAQPSPAAAQPTSDARESMQDPIEQLKKLGELRDAGILTAEEFDAKKAEILNRM